MLATVARLRNLVNHEIPYCRTADPLAPLAVMDTVFSHPDSPDPDALVAAALLPALVADLSRDRIVAANPGALRLLGPGPPGPRFSRHLGAGVARMIVFADEVAHRGEAWTRDIPLLDGEGHARPVELRARFVGPSGGLLLVQLIDLDDMDRHAHAVEVARLQRAGLFEWQRTQRFFADLERQNQLILNAAGEGIYGLNAEGKTTFVNRAAQEMLGWTAEDLLGRDIHSIIHHHHLNGEVYPAQSCPIYQSFRFEKVHRIEDEVFWRKDGRPIRVEYVSTPIYDAQVLAGAVVIFRDITERKENERRLREALAEVAALRDRLEQENAYLQEEISAARAHHDILGDSPAIRQLVTRIERAAPTDASVLVTGEPGTGKSLVASAIHKESDRRRRPLITFACGSVPREAVEAELFGQVRAAAGATRDRPGKLELAHGGTLFLDEVAALPPEVQGLLLSALQARQVTRLGDTRAREIDLRVIASTARDLEREVAADRFRPDLYFHLSVVPMRCIPLRDRPEDIPVLAQSLLERACTRLRRPAPTLTAGVMQRLQRYGWPGNVRELSNVMERGAIISTEKFVLDLAEGGDPRGAGRRVLSEAEMMRLQRDNLTAALRETGGRVAGAGGAAERLGLKPTTVYSRIRAWGLDADEPG